MTPFPSCPECGGESFRRSSLFGDAVRRPLRHDVEGAPDWLDEARDALVREGDYLAFEDDERVRVFPLQDGWTRIGRSLSAHVRFDDPTVSRRHALLYRDDGGARILDDRSLNGVFRNGDRVELAELEDGDEISIGRFSLFFVSLVGATVTHLSSAKPASRGDDGPVAELALGARDVDRALLRGDPDREAGERRRAGALQQPPDALARGRCHPRHAGGHRPVRHRHTLRGEQLGEEFAEHRRLAVRYEIHAAGGRLRRRKPEALDGVVDVRRRGQLAAAADPAEAA